MDTTQDVTARAPPNVSAGMDHSEEMVAELDEPPDEMQHTYRANHFWSPPKMHSGHTNKAPQFNRRESLLTRQLHSETEHTDDERHMPGRALSTQSTFSNPSTTSTAELTSDDGHSVASPAISPPLPPTHITTSLPVRDKPLDRRVKIVGQEGMGRKGDGTEKTVEANLGRKRCITFACKGKLQDKAEPDVTSPEPPKTESATPPKRKCTIKFACPTRTASSEKVAEKPAKRPASPAPLTRRPSADARSQAFRAHRGSDSTVTHASPKAIRKPSMSRSASIREDSQPRRPKSTRKYSNESVSSGNEATRFHEFGTSEDEPEDWTRESTCHRSRLTLDDVMKKEKVIRQACEEAEEEVVEDEEEDEVDEQLDEQEDEMAAVGDDEEDEVEDEGGDSDEGFHSDNEAGFASSDDDDSDYEWWKPGPSTAATSVEHLDRLAIVNAKPAEHSSVGSASSGAESARSMRHRHRRHAKSAAMNIENRPPTPDLPDSTDFVCGTLDEDRPLEQAYIHQKQAKEAAQRKARPQDIDPSFPTSDPEMDEEDDDDVDEVVESDDEHDLMHGGMDNIHDVAPLRRRTSQRGRGRSNSHRSPAPPKHFSPPPQGKRRSVAKSPPPPTKRGLARSPAPRKLFGHSPTRMRSPAPGKRMMTSPPNSPTNAATPLAIAPHLGERPRLQHTASLPRGAGFIATHLAAVRNTRPDSGDSHDSDGDAAAAAVDIPKRGAIDIVKGLEKKRGLRKAKLYQKMCAKQAAKGEKQYKVKPGKGCQRMRELGVRIQEYKGGRAEHILSL